MKDLEDAIRLLAKFRKEMLRHQNQWLDCCNCFGEYAQEIDDFLNQDNQPQ